MTERTSKAVQIAWILLEAFLGSLLLYCLLGPLVIAVRAAQAEQDTAKAAVFVMIGIGMTMHGLYFIHRLVRNMRAQHSRKGDQR
jgi:hypothetical protein